MSVVAVANGNHAPEDAIGQQVDRDVGEGDRHQLVERVGVAGAEVVGQVGVNGLDPGPALQLVGERLTDVGLVAVAEGIGLADLRRASRRARWRPRWR